MKYDHRSSSVFILVALLGSSLFVDVKAQGTEGLTSAILTTEAVAVTDGEGDSSLTTTIATAVETVSTALVTNDFDGMEALSDSNSTMETPADTLPPTDAPTEAPVTNAPTGPVPVLKSTCYDNTNDIYEVSKDDRLLYENKKFILCPNTVYDIGIYRFNETFSGIIDGQYPLVPRMNTIIQCGESGDVSNNCTIRGGDWGLITVPLIHELDFDTSDVLIKGITFESQVLFSIFFGLPGTNFVIDDCVIKNNVNQGPIIFNNRGPWNFRRHLSRYDKYEDPWAKVHHYMNDLQAGKMDEHRELQNDDIATLHATIKDSVIQNNTQAVTGHNLEFGIITFRVDTHNATFKNNLFIDNNYGDEALSSIGYALLNVGSEVHLNDNCFVDNSFFGSGMIIMNPGSLFDYKGNYATCSDREKLTCPFVVSFKTEQAEEDNDYNCYDNAAGTTCGYFPVAGKDSCNVNRDGTADKMEAVVVVDPPVVTDTVTEPPSVGSSGFILAISNISLYMLLPAILLVAIINA